MSNGVLQYKRQACILGILWEISARPALSPVVCGTVEAPAGVDGGRAALPVLRPPRPWEPAGRRVHYYALVIQRYCKIGYENEDTQDRSGIMHGGPTFPRSGGVQARPGDPLHTDPRSV